jgi:hypothetical protein
MTDSPQDNPVSDIANQIDQPTPVVPEGKPRNRSVWQVGLRTLFLVVVAIGVWIGYLQNRKRIDILKQRIKVMQTLAHELVIHDPGKIAVVQKEALWHDDNRWEIHLPKGAYRICLATREIPPNAGAGPVVASEPIEAGRHTVSLVVEKEKSAWHITVTRDGATALTAAEPIEWNDGHGSSTSGGFSESNELDPAEPVFLMRRHFMRRGPNGVSRSPSGPAEGILLWIEPARDQAPVSGR